MGKERIITTKTNQEDGESNTVDAGVDWEMIRRERGELKDTD